jgi:hypothetical protein
MAILIYLYVGHVAFRCELLSVFQCCLLSHVTFLLFMLLFDECYSVSFDVAFCRMLLSDIVMLHFPHVTLCLLVVAL